LHRPQAHRYTRGPERRGQIDEQPEDDEAEEVDPVSEHLHARREPDPEDDRRRDEEAAECGQHPPCDDGRPVRRGQEEAAREAALEIPRDREACEHPTERGRLEEDEDELERRVAGGEVEAGHLGNTREAARERREEEEREEQRRQEERGRREEAVELTPGDWEGDRHEAAPHARASLTLSAREAETSAIRPIAATIPTASASAWPSQPTIT